MEISLVSETYPNDVNGVATTLGSLVTGLTERGHAVDVICPKQAKRPAGFSGHQVAGLAVPFYPEVRVGFYRQSAFIERWQQDPPDVVHIATEGPLGLNALKAAKRLDLRISTSFHTNFHDYARAYHLGWLTRPAMRYLRWFHNQSARTFVPTKSQVNTLSAAGFCRLAVLGRGVDTTLFHPARRDERLRMHWGASEQTPVLLYVGRLAAEKNLDLLVIAIKKAQWINPAAVVVIVGDGPERRWLQTRLPDVIFMGTLTGESLARCYASADIFIQPSESETFGIVLLEAMASGLVTLSYDYAAGAAVVDDGYNGYLAAYKEPSAFLNALPEVLDFDHNIGQRARQTACQYAWDGVVDDFEHQLQQLTATAQAYTGSSIVRVGSS